MLKSVKKFISKLYSFVDELVPILLENVKSSANPHGKLVLGRKWCKVLALAQPLRSFFLIFQKSISYMCMHTKSHSLSARI